MRLRGGMVAAIGSLALAVIGYVAGRAIGAAGVAQWISRRSYRSVRQLGARGVVGVIVLRLSSVASTGAIHLLCGAGRVPFVNVHGRHRHRHGPGDCRTQRPWRMCCATHCSIRRCRTRSPRLAVAVLLIVLASAMRTLLLIRQFAPSVAVSSRPRGVRLMTSPPPNLRVATYNVHACVGTDGRHDPDRVAAVIAELDADIVALQEFTYPASVAIEIQHAGDADDGGSVRVCAGADPSTP